MPSIGFICPDKSKVTYDQCLKQPCHLGERCMTKSTLTALLPHREWKGKPSTTQLLKPTLVSFLEITRDYYVDPLDMVNMFVGTKVHRKLQLAETDVSKLEVEFEDDDMTGVADCYELEDGVSYLTDHKVVGSYSIKKMLSGDLGDYALQLNRYRLFFEDAGIHIDHMRLEVFPKDGYLELAKKLGTPKKVTKIAVPRMDDTKVRAYFAQKRQSLMVALEHPESYPAQCSPEETWNRRRCSGYCSVRAVCPYIGTRRITQRRSS